MIPGRLNKIITIQGFTLSPGDYGGQVKSWSNFATVWAHIAPLRGREVMAAQAAQSETTVRFYTRYLPGLVSGMRIVYAGKYYDITSIIDIDEKHVEMEILTKTGVSEG